VSVAQDRDRGVVTLAGHVPADADKTEAASVTPGLASGQVVANEITVTPAGAEDEATRTRDALDDGIDGHVKAMLEKRLPGDDVKYSVESGVVTLTGTVASQARRTQIEKATIAVSNATQVVNKLDVKNQKATSRGGGL
jgi:osmotically-inducible protein OsmY